MKIVIVSLKGVLVFPYVGKDYDLSYDLQAMPEQEKKLFLDFNVNQLARLLIETVQSDKNDLNTTAVVANRYAQLSQSPQEYEAESEYLVLEVNLEPDVCKWSMVIPHNTVSSDEEAITFIRSQYNARFN
ncbi:MAG: hypothetical protein EOP56_14410 [Sphingobacteriales bacterium]|nr:MAG: hypothetical protein EOP56_14410 [Sphingobacteriales bacterium]